MTLAGRNRIILSGVLVIGLLAAAFVVSVVGVLRSLPLDSALQGRQLNVVSVEVSLLAELLFCLGTVIILYFSFRKTTSAEIFFFIVFVVSMSLDSLKSVQLLLMIRDQPVSFGMLVTRVILFGEYLGILALFAAGLFSTGLPYQRLEIVLGLALLLAFALASAVPVDMNVNGRDLVHGVATGNELMIISILFQFFAVLNFVLAGFQKSSGSYFIIALGAGMAMAGRELLFYRLDSISVIAAFVLLIAGSTLFGERTHEVHLWT